MAAGDGDGVTVVQVLEQWPLLEYVFHAHLGIDLEQVWRVKSWRWFRTRVAGLLTEDNLLSRHFRPRPEGSPHV